jgi:hypothetical protein
MTTCPIEKDQMVSGEWSIERCQAANNNDHCTNRDIHTILDPRDKRNQ